MVPGLQEVDATADISKGQSARCSVLGREEGYCVFTGFEVFGSVMDCSLSCKMVWLNVVWWIEA